MFEYLEEGGLCRAKFFLNGLLHRLDGPADICWYPDETPCHEFWYANDVRHRADGPASTFFDEQGEIMFTKWFFNGVETTR